MATDESRDISLTLTLESERVELADIIGTLRDVRAMLADIERRVRNVPHAKVRWAWADENPLLEVVATVNGVSKDELTRIVADARQGFVNAGADYEPPYGSTTPAPWYGARSMTR